MISSRVVLSIPAPPPHLPPRLQDWSPVSTLFPVPDSSPQTTREHVSPLIFTSPEAKKKNKKRKKKAKKKKHRSRRRRRKSGSKHRVRGLRRNKSKKEERKEKDPTVSG
jgi:hypothetical protein